jgi:hypothetical protein
MSFCRLRGRRRLGVDQEIKISKTERSSHQPNSKSWSGGNTRAESAAPPELRGSQPPFTFRKGEKRARRQLPTSDSFALRKHQQSMSYARTEAQTAFGSGQSDRISSQK